MRKFIIYCFCFIVIFAAGFIEVNAAEPEIYEITIYPNKNNNYNIYSLNSLNNDEKLKLKDVDVDYSVNEQDNTININFSYDVFVDRIISTGDTIHNNVICDNNYVLDINENLDTDVVVGSKTSNISISYDNIKDVDSITIQSADYDFSGGLLDGVKFTRDSNGYMTDNNLDTGLGFFRYPTTSIPSYSKCNFDEPVDISYGKFYAQGALTSGAVLRFRFKDVNGYFMDVTFRDSISGYHEFNVNFNYVKEIEIFCNPNNSIDIKEFNAYEMDVIENVRNVNYFLENNIVTITWDNPDIYDGIKIYRDGEYIITTTEESFSETLDSGEYTYTIITVDDKGNESEGVSVSVTIEKPPEEVKNLNYTVEGNNIVLTWTNPTNEEFEGVNIYRNGEYITTTTGESFSEDLPSGIYQYRITTIEAGKESPGITVDVSIMSAPTTVKNIRIINMTSTGGEIMWTENPAYENVEKYIVYVNGEKHGETEAPPYPLEDLEEGKTYNIGVRAINSYGESEPPATIIFTPTKLAEIGNSIKIGDIFAYISMLFSNMWPLLAIALAILFTPKIIQMLKSNVT